MGSNIIKNMIFAFVALMLMQVFIFSNIVLFDVSFCFIYVGIILMAPLEMASIWVMLLAFATGFLADSIYYTYGQHAAACVFIGFIRRPVLNFFTPSSGYENTGMLTASEMGIRWYLPYGLLLILLHHTTFFYIEAWGSGGFFFTLVKVLCSSLFTFIMLIIMQYLIFYQRGSR